MIIIIISRWDLTSHTKVAHNGEKVMCPNCGSCFSKKSNLYNHLHRGKGCPKRGDGDSPGHAPSHAPVTPKREAEQRQRFRREKIKYAEVKDEQFGESEDELSDLVIDDRNQSEIITDPETRPETDEELGEEEEEVEEVEESYIEVREPRVQNRLEFLKANRDLLQRPSWTESDSKSTPSPPPSAAPAPAPGLNNLHLLADIAMAHTQYSSDTGSTSDQETPDTQQQPAQQSQAPAPSPPTPPLNLSTTASRGPGVVSLVPGYRDIKPQVVGPGQLSTRDPKLKAAVPGSRVVAAPLPGVRLVSPGQYPQYQVIPVTVPSPAPSHAPVVVIQPRHGPAGVIQLTQPSQVAASLLGVPVSSMGRLV